MLALQTEVKGSAGYVALERVSGKLAGKQGSFVLQHSATMYKGEADVEDHAWCRTRPPANSPDCRGKMVITVAEDGAHHYEFDFKIDAAPLGVAALTGTARASPGSRGCARTSRVRRIAVSTPW